MISRGRDFIPHHSPGDEGGGLYTGAGHFNTPHPAGKIFMRRLRADGRTMQMGTITSLDICHTMTHMIDPPPGQ